MIIMSNSSFWFEHFNFTNRDLSSVKIIVVFNRQVSGVKLIVGGTMSFLEAGEFLTHLHLRLHLSAEVPSGEDSVVGNPMVHGSGLVVVQVLEVSGI